MLAVDHVSFEASPGEFVSIVGPSGCGKTTLLRAIAGFERIDAGRIRVSGQAVAGPGVYVAPERRRVTIVPQEQALFPHLTVAANVGYGVRRGPERDRAVEAMLELAGLAGLGSRMPHELSGGQQQRVALARALAPSPSLILLDEPFSNLDATLRTRLRGEVREVIREAGITAVFVTHDREEALSISDRVAVMVEGRVLQTGTPQEVYAAPVGRRVAALVGDVSLIPGRVRDQAASTSIGVVPAPGRADGPADVLIRPEFVRVDPDPSGDARVTAVEFYGHDQLVRIALGDGTGLESRPSGPRSDLAVGTRVRVALDGPAQVLPTGPEDADRTPAEPGVAEPAR